MKSFSILTSSSKCASLLQQPISRSIQAVFWELISQRHSLEVVGVSFNFGIHHFEIQVNQNKSDTTLLIIL